MEDLPNELLCSILQFVPDTYRQTAILLKTNHQLHAATLVAKQDLYEDMKNLSGSKKINNNQALATVVNRRIRHGCRYYDDDKGSAMHFNDCVVRMQTNNLNTIVEFGRMKVPLGMDTVEELPSKVRRICKIVLKTIPRLDNVR